MISPDQFEEACINLKDYHGVVGVFGGNPALHPEFDLLCAILRKHIPFYRRGLWCNHPRGRGRVMADTFNPAHSNLNVHQVAEAYDEFKRDWPASMPFGIDRPGVRNEWKDDSRHSPVMGSMLDLEYLPGGLENTEENRYEFISQCDINHHWSGMFGAFRGNLRFWFCEVAGAQAMLNQHKPDYPDTGYPPSPRVWAGTMDQYAPQVRQYCHRCLVPLRGYGELATHKTGVQHTTKEYADIFRPKTTGALVQLVTKPEEFQAQALSRMTSYVENASVKAEGK
jgi:hypothetical protein